MFDLILGTQAIDELGINLDVNYKMITINEIELLMTSIMPKSRHRALVLTKV